MLVKSCFPERVRETLFDRIIVHLFFIGFIAPFHVYFYNTQANFLSMEDIEKKFCPTDVSEPKATECFSDIGKKVR